MPLTDRSDSLDTRNLTVNDLLELGPATPVEFKEMAAPATPAAGALTVYAKTDGKVYAKNAAGIETDLTAGAAGGEANTASNVGTAGVGVFKQKTGVNLELKNINAGSAKIVVSDDAANGEVDIDLGSVALADLSDVSAKTGTGSTAVMQVSPTITTPSIADFSNAGHDHQNAAGGGALSALAIASGTLNSARLAAKNKTITKVVYIENPIATDSFPVTFVADSVTLVQVRGVTDIGTVDFNLERRATNTPDVAGTDILTADLQALAAGASTAAFVSSGAVAAEQWLSYNASAVSGTPTKLWVVIEFTID